MNTSNETMSVFKTFTCPDCDTVKTVPADRNETVEQAAVIICDQCGKMCEVVTMEEPSAD